MTSVIGAEAQVDDSKHVSDSGDQTYNDVMFMLNTKAQVDDDEFVTDAGGQTNVEENTLDVENQTSYDARMECVAVQNND